MFIDGLVGYLLFAPHSWLEILLGFWALYMIVQWGKRLLSPKSRSGFRPQRSVMGAMQPSAPLPINAIASIGSGKSPRSTVNGQVLKPTAGLVALPYAGFAVMAYFTYQMGPEVAFAGSGAILTAACFLFALSETLYLTTFELKLDATGFDVRDRLHRNRRVDFRKLVQVTDDNHYLYSFTLEDGSKIRVPKYLVGMSALLDSAEKHLKQYAHG